MVDLRKVIKRYGVTQIELANRWGVYQSAVSQMLGGGKISLEKLYDLADACNCSVSELVAEENTAVLSPTPSCPFCGNKLNIHVNISKQ